MRKKYQAYYLQTALSSGRTVLHPTQADFRVAKFAMKPTFDVTTERVRVWSPSNPIKTLYTPHTYTYFFRLYAYAITKIPLWIQGSVRKS